MSKHRRGRGEGSIYRRTDGRWVGAVSIGGSKRKSVYGRTASEAREKIRKVQQQIASGMLPDADFITVETFCRSFLESTGPTVKDSTLRRYEQLLRVHVIPHFGQRKLAAVKPGDLEAFYSKLIDKGLSPQTVTHVHRVLHVMFRKATQWEILGRNVVSLVRPPRTVRKEMRVLTPYEISNLYRIAEGTRLESLWRMAIGTGARLGEMLALQWHEVNLERGSLRISGTIDRSPEKGLVKTEPKTKSSRRQIYLPKSIVSSLRRHRVLQNEERLKLGSAWVDTGYVFTTLKGTIVNPNNVGRRDFKPLLQKASIVGHVRIHDLRHTAISLALSEGVPPLDVSQMAGHSSVAVTLQLYAHALPDAPKRAADAIEKLIGG